MRFRIEKSAINIPIEELYWRCCYGDYELDCSDNDFPSIVLLDIFTIESFADVLESEGIPHYQESSFNTWLTNKIKVRK